MNALTAFVGVIAVSMVILIAVAAYKGEQLADAWREIQAERCEEDEVLVRYPYPDGELICRHVDQLR